MRKSLLPTACLLFFVSMTSVADEVDSLRDRVAQLEATVEELTLQLADSLTERRRLEAELAGALATAQAAVAAPAVAASADPVADGTALTDTRSPAGDAIRETAVTSDVSAAATPAAAAASGYTSTAGCDVAGALAGYEGKRAGNEALEAWLQADDHLDTCSTAQLKQLRDAVKWDWLGYEKPVLKLLDGELARR